MTGERAHTERRERSALTEVCTGARGCGSLGQLHYLRCIIVQLPLQQRLAEKTMLIAGYCYDAADIVVHSKHR